MKNIGIYDSGCGGFSVIQQLLNTGYTGNIYYYGDTINNPWGNKTKLELKVILDIISEWFKLHNISTIFSGCNTTLSLFKDELPSIFNTPVHNILENTENHYTDNDYTVLSTENSCENHLFSNFLPNKTIQEIPCPNLANLIEKNKIANALSLAHSFIKTAIFPTIILGCTHYPLIINELKTAFPEKIFIDPAKFLKFQTAPLAPSATIHFKTTGDVALFNTILSQHIPLNEYTLNKTIYKNATPVIQKHYSPSPS